MNAQNKVSVYASSVVCERDLLSMFVCTQRGWTALMSAASVGQVSVVEVLLNREARTDLKNEVSVFVCLCVQ